MKHSTENMSKLYDKTNSKGKQQVLLSLLGKIVKENKILVIDAFAKEGIIIDNDISDEKLIKLIRMNLLSKKNPKTAKNLRTSFAILIAGKKDNENFIDYSNLSAILYDTDNSESLNFLNATKKVRPPKVAKPPKVKGVKKKDGNVVTRLFKRGEDGTSKAGNYYRNNKETIDIIGLTLLDGLSKQGSTSVVMGGLDNDIENNSQSNTKKQINPIIKYSIIGGVVLVVLYFGYNMYVKSAKSQGKK